MGMFEHADSVCICLRHRQSLGFQSEMEQTRETTSLAERSLPMRHECAKLLKTNRRPNMMQRLSHYRHYPNACKKQLVLYIYIYIYTYIYICIYIFYEVAGAQPPSTTRVAKTCPASRCTYIYTCTAVYTGMFIYIYSIYTFTYHICTYIYIY